MNEIEKEIDSCVLSLTEDDWARASQGLVKIVGWLGGYVERIDVGVGNSRTLLDLLSAVTKAIEVRDCIQLADLLGYDLKAELMKNLKTGEQNA